MNGKLGAMNETLSTRHRKLETENERLAAENKKLFDGSNALQTQNRMLDADNKQLVTNLGSGNSAVPGCVFILTCRSKENYRVAGD